MEESPRHEPAVDHARRDRGRPGRDPAQRPGAPRAGGPGAADDGGQGRRLRPRDGPGRRGRPRGRARTGSVSPRSTRRWPCAPPATSAGCSAGSTCRASATPRRSSATSTSRRTRWPSSTRSPAPPTTCTGRRGCSSRSTPGCPGAARPRTTGRSWSPPPRGCRSVGWCGSPASGPTSPAATSPSHPANDAQEQAFREALDVAERGGAAARGAPPGQLGGRRAAPVLAVRPGPVRDRVVRPGPRAGRHARPRAGAGHDRPGHAVAEQADRRRRGRLLRPHLDRRPGHDRRAGPRGLRRRRTPACRQRGRGLGRRSSAPGPRPGLHGPVRGRPRRGPARAGQRGRAVRARRGRRAHGAGLGARPAAPSTTRSSPGSAAGCTAATSTKGPRR